MLKKFGRNASIFLTRIHLRNLMLPEHNTLILALSSDIKDKYYGAFIRVPRLDNPPQTQAFKQAVSLSCVR